MFLNIVTIVLKTCRLLLLTPAVWLYVLNLSTHLITGWVKNRERARTCTFALPWQQPTMYYFYVKAGNPSNFNPKDVTGVKFGFVDGFVADEFCLARQSDIRVSLLLLIIIIQIGTLIHLHICICFLFSFFERP